MGTFELDFEMATKRRAELDDAREKRRMSHVSTFKELYKGDAPSRTVEGLIHEAKEELDKAHPGPSREKAMVHTKLDEALLWLSKVV